jgi:hypothetical protein
MTTAESSAKGFGTIPARVLPGAKGDIARYLPISVDQYHRVIDSGILPEDSSVELLHGLLVRKDRSSPGKVQNQEDNVFFLMSCSENFLNSRAYLPASLRTPPGKS